jgi:hypothetical protein
MRVCGVLCILVYAVLVMLGIWVPLWVLLGDEGLRGVPLAGEAGCFRPVPSE